MELKEELYTKCLGSLDSRFETVQRTVSELQEALLSETKSSAGDKHETGRAMLQLEREKAGYQLLEIQKVKEILSKIDVTKTNKNISLGSIIYTSKANYFIAISAGAFKVNFDTFYAISSNTPMGKLLMSKTVGDTIVFRNESIVIEKVI
ncbi:3-oxoacyl-ACP synthase [Flavobacteriales bacterium 34_180_T64]|nr:3-oxoacyl-ACP synthase [Flavobacteriales bacterium 34_180_T64]